ncbi:DUF4412 domain-containing protein [Phragmitibacter flavus]|uniref:DUF4412 domain-containing protein n=1 Tax=Phragmitibacter flavus TaxID=2576071 RepID=A0A5R8KAX6_9BACT|nr:DUF4412 domain-containing protein [Phragmitibacter flavus]TLD69460.1 DUF4412 domain-containing protein [Phragmitibacter flavus]
MKTKINFLIGTAFAITSIAQADLVIEQTIENSTQPTSKMTLKVKGNKIRTDLGNTTTSIVNIETMENITLMHPTKMVIKTDPAQIKTAAETTVADPDIKAIDNGKTEEVNGYKCAIWTIEHSGTKMTFWATNDFPDYAEFKEEYEKLTTIPDAPNPTGGIDGLVIKTQMETAGTTSTITINSIKKTPVDDSEFEISIPAGYQEINLPK